jgi:hypothetical protein
MWQRERKLRAVVGVVAVIALLAACSTMPVGVEYDHAARFAGYHEFACLPGATYGAAGASVVQEGREAIERELARKGFKRAEDASTADFLVDFRLGAQDRTEVHTYPPPYDGRWWSLQDWWGHPDWAYTLDVRQYREGMLVIDIYDARSRARIWHGWTRKELTRSDVQHSAGLIRAAAHSVLKGFPPR